VDYSVLVLFEAASSLLLFLLDLGRHPCRFNPEYFK
jgi:hypothetical protein